MTIAKAIDVPPRRINEIVHGKRAITADTALRLSRALGLTDMFWIINATEALTSKAGSQGRTATRRVAVIVYSPPMTGNRPESLGSHWGLETVNRLSRRQKRARTREVRTHGLVIRCSAGRFASRASGRRLP